MTVRLTAYRIYLFPISFLSLAIGFYLTYWKKSARGGIGSCSGWPRSFSLYFGPCLTCSAQAGCDVAREVGQRRRKLVPVFFALMKERALRRGRLRPSNAVNT